MELANVLFGLLQMHMLDYRIWYLQDIWDCVNLMILMLILRDIIFVTFDMNLSFLRSKSSCIWIKAT